MDYSEHQNLMTLEGETELLVDCLRELELEFLEVDQQKIFGTYRNEFTCIAKNDLGDGITEHQINAKFYEQESAILLVLLVCGEGEEASMEGLYWLDQSGGSEVPEEHPEWAEIRENMDIFLDDD